MRRFLIMASSGAIVAGLALSASPLAATAQTSSYSIALLSPNGGTSASPTSVAPGSTVQFANTYPSGTKNPADEVNCYQNGTWVYGEVLSISQETQYGFSLPNSSATCSANLVSVTFSSKGGESVTSLASTAFAIAS